MQTAETILCVVGLYATLGLLFAAAFVTVGITRVDPTAKGSPVVFRLLILPGAAALWPILAAKWLAIRHAQGART